MWLFSMRVSEAKCGYFRCAFTKTELIHRKGPWRNVEHVEWATLNYVDWFNNRRIHESLDYVPPVEFEAHYYDSSESENLAAMEMI